MTDVNRAWHSFLSIRGPIVSKSAPSGEVADGRLFIRAGKTPGLSLDRSVNILNDKRQLDIIGVVVLLFWVSINFFEINH